MHLSRPLVGGGALLPESGGASRCAAAAVRYDGIHCRQLHRSSRASLPRRRPSTRASARRRSRSSPRAGGSSAWPTGSTGSRRCLPTASTASCSRCCKCQALFPSLYLVAVVLHEHAADVEKPILAYEERLRLAGLGDVPARNLTKGRLRGYSRFVFWRNCGAGLLLDGKALTVKAPLPSRCAYRASRGTP